jgi:hypothetical protein
VGDRRLIAAALAALALAGCGATPPQAPGPQAHQLNLALSRISSACGHASEIQEFSKDSRDLRITERQAQQQIGPLVRIHRQNPNWIFQGKSVSELVNLSSTYLDECGLHMAAQRLRQALSRK